MQLTDKGSLLSLTTKQTPWIKSNIAIYYASVKWNKEEIIHIK